MSYFVNMKIINNTLIVNFCLAAWFLLEKRGVKGKSEDLWGHSHFGITELWLMVSEGSSPTHVFTNAQRVWIFKVPNLQYRVMFKVDKMTHFVICYMNLLIWHKNTMLWPLFTVTTVWKLRNDTEKMTNNCCHCMNLCGFMWLKVYQPPHSVLGQPHIYITAT